MSNRQLLDPRWHWLRTMLQKLYEKMDDDSIPASISICAANGEDLVSYSVSPGDPIECRIITNLDVLVEVTEATTVVAGIGEEEAI